MPVRRQNNIEFKFRTLPTVQNLCIKPARADWLHTDVVDGNKAIWTPGKGNHLATEDQVGQSIRSRLDVREFSQLRRR